MWESHGPVEQEVSKVEDTSERVVNYKKIMVTDVKIDLTFYAQHVDEGEINVCIKYLSFINASFNVLCITIS